MKKRKSAKVNSTDPENNLSRKEALKRIGIAGFSAATMLLLLNKPAKAQFEDTSTDPGDPGGGW